jgi:hypothetical protein
MSESTTNQQKSEEELFLERKELFRYTDINHPLIQVLFNLQITSPTEEAE